MINGRMLYRVKPILNHPPPMILRHLRGFLSIAGYCHIWILGYEELAQRLYNLITETQQAQTNKLVWSPETQKAFQFSSVQSLSHVWLFVTPWTTELQASGSITNSQSLSKLMSIESGMPSNHLILCHPLPLPSIFPSIKWVSSSNQVAKVLEFQLQHQSFQWTLRTDFL